MLIFTLLAAQLSYAYILNATIASDSTGLPVGLYYDTSAKNFLDGTTSNPNVKLRVYYTVSGDVPNGAYGGFAYLVNSSYYVFTTTTNGNYGLDPFGAEQGTAGAYYRDTTSALDTPGVYPAYAYAVISANSSADPGDTFVYMPQSSGWLRGSISVPSFASTYNQNTGQVTLLGISSITGTSTTGPSSITADNQQIAIGVCTDTIGQNCSSSALTTRTGTVLLQTGVTAAQAKAQAQTRYLVYNGFSTSFSIGTDLSCSSPSYSPSGTVYNGDNLTISAIVTNAGNVNVSTPFNVTFYKNSINSSNVLGSALVSTEITPGSAVTGSLTINTSQWNLSNANDNPTTFWVSCDSSNVVNEISESNNNASSSKTIYKVVYMDVYVDGNLSTNFTYAGRPYNVTVNVYDSAGGSHFGDMIQAAEYNGVSIFAPIQVWAGNSSNYSLKPTSLGVVMANESGSASFAIIPTGNRTYAYNPALYSAALGQYYISISSFTGSGVPLKSVNMTVLNPNPLDPGSQKTGAINQNQVVGINNIVNTLYNYIAKWLS
ncbi:MAG TPA: CARDB domain-containing protein [Candidatus Micrarchaeota archaeon]|nr:CARDB domain-containing protein [Candidatus Micrarchaeota archaeon]